MKHSLLTSLFTVAILGLFGAFAAPNVAAGDSITLLKFEADWCGPCQMMKPVVNKVSNSFGSQVMVRSINIDTNPALASKYRVQSIPHIVAIKNGKVVGKLTGYQSEAALTRFVNRKL